MTWILIRDTLPITNPPPRLSLFWSEPWSYTARTKAAQRSIDSRFENEDDEFGYDMFGKEPNGRTARKIRYNGEEIRVFPHEFSVVSDENMRIYVWGIFPNGEIADPSHTLVLDQTYAEQLIDPRQNMDGDVRLLYDAALTEGAGHEQAVLLATGQNPDDVTIPPIGWYRMHPEYAAYF